MTSRPEVAEVFGRYRDRFLERYCPSADQRRVLRDLSACRTAALGGHVRKCDHCDHLEISYNSCRNRHCPKCQCRANAQWLEAQMEYLLEVEYFHVVFTLPETLGPMALQNPRIIYSILFRAASETLQSIARDPKYLGAQIGFLAILHTWGQTLHHHPHLHCVVPAGGISPDSTRWIASRNGFFLPVRVLSRLFQKKFLHYLKQAYRQQQLSFYGKLHYLCEPNGWRHALDRATQSDWVVYCKPPFGGAHQVLKYLARYTHRVAISNQRLLSIEQGQVAFRWKDYRHGCRQRQITLEAAEFIRRFLQHTLPKGFVRIRHYGFLSNRCRKQKLPLCRQLLATHPLVTDSAPASSTPLDSSTDPICPLCQQGRLLLMRSFRSLPAGFLSHIQVQANDTS